MRSPRGFRERLLPRRGDYLAPVSSTCILYLYPLLVSSTCILYLYPLRVSSPHQSFPVFSWWLSISCS